MLAPNYPSTRTVDVVNNNLVKNVIVSDRVSITRMRPEHIADIIPMSSPDGGSDPWNFSAQMLPEVMQRFPEGQSVALVDGKVVSYAITMRTNRSPDELPLSWAAMIGDMTLKNHDSNGEWLYGVDFYVNVAYRCLGIGTKMYQARFNLVRRLNLRGMYAGGMLAGYDRYRRQMSVREYGEKVILGELEDPTVTMQMRRGFRPRAMIENYTDSESAGYAAMLIEWDNPDWRNPDYLPYLRVIPSRRTQAVHNELIRNESAPLTEGLNRNSHALNQN
ncbi:MAG TPA: hypothetical protein VHL11_19210 [Phototrophicaceae bacterium]|jgi:hypothetical protein|nr:hypothetical protein [Phototrophicaceae bacterium]